MKLGATACKPRRASLVSAWRAMSCMQETTQSKICRSSGEPGGALLIGKGLPSPQWNASFLASGRSVQSWM